VPLEIPRNLVEYILLGPEDDRRQLQDSPILGDVWVMFAKSPGEKQELLITPYRDYPAGRVASELATCNVPGADIAYLQGIVAARLTLEEVLQYVVPMTQWWSDRRMQAAIDGYVTEAGQQTMRRDIGSILATAKDWMAGKQSAGALQGLETRKRYIALAGLLIWASRLRTGPARKRVLSSDQIFAAATPAEISTALGKLYARRRETQNPKSVWTISLNRRAMPALTKSVPAVKADAARTLFTVDCKEIVWAIIDSGIDATHDAFLDHGALQERRERVSRVRRAFDFTNIRNIVKLDGGADDESLRQRVATLQHANLKAPPSSRNIKLALKELAADARRGRSIDWELVENLVEIDPSTPPRTIHGTHVAGILAADKRAAEEFVRQRAEDDKADPVAAVSESNSFGDWANGVCPEISLYDFRVLAPTLMETEFAIIAALQFIRYINERNSFITVHGANLSLSIPHDVRNYACGRTPVCNECERLVNSGVVVIAAAGNRGFQHYETKTGTEETYAAFSVTDPGNADNVITVGATHRYWPHTYGVSFFSSRGPTGDGRLKPDLVAPGERIRAPLPGNEWGDLDGTSMAAPHVSGAAAMLMARYSELIGRPQRIKTILTGSATDLGRERTFQGHGMLDVLRAFQSI
jgi:serine protease AprX